MIAFLSLLGGISVVSPYTRYGRWSIIIVKGGAGGSLGRLCLPRLFVHTGCGWGKLLEPKRSRLLLLLWLGGVRGGVEVGSLEVWVLRVACREEHRHLVSWLWTSRIGRRWTRLCPVMNETAIMPWCAFLQET